jgi:hypothetical protein
VYGIADHAVTGIKPMTIKEHIIGNATTVLGLVISVAQINQILTAVSLLVAIIVNVQLLRHRFNNRDNKSNKDF